MCNTSGSAECAEKRGEVDKELVNLNATIERVGCGIETLKKRTESVRTAKPLTTGGVIKGVIKDESALVPMANRIRTMNRRLIETLEELNDVLKSIEL